MNNPPDDIRQWIQELISRSASDQMVSQKRFEELVRRATRGEINQAELREEYLQFAQQEGLRYVRDLTRVGLGFYNTLLELNRQYNDRFYNHVLHDQPSGNGAARPVESPVRIVDMDFRGVSGGEISRSFAIENQRTETVSVGFLISEFTDPGGKVSFRPPLQFSPARFTLGPGEERMVNIQIPLLPEFFRPGLVYTATVIVSGFEQLQLRLNVSVEASPAGETAPEGGGPVFKPVDEIVQPPAEPADDLKRIKGVGPVYVQKLRQAGLTTYSRLAACDRETLIQVLGPAAAERARRLQWQEQARLAARNEWEDLNALQSSLPQG